MTGIDLTRKRFEDEAAARRFFEDLGFSIERHSFVETAAELVLPRKLDLSPDGSSPIPN
jgi:hypothetical protein